MKKWVPWLVFAIFVLYILGGFRPPKSDDGYDYSEFAKIPVLLNGRVQPLDSMARNTLLMSRGKQTVVVQEGSWFPYKKAVKIPAIQLLAEAMMNPEKADTRKIFRIDHPDLQSFWQEPSSSGERKYFSYKTIASKHQEIEQ